MPITRNLTYVPTITKIEKEEDVIELLRTMRLELGDIRASFEGKSLTEILKIIESRSCEIKLPEARGIVEVVNLGLVSRIISEYRALSEGGCDSCKKKFQTLGVTGGGPYAYCRKHEKKSDVDQDIGMSPRIRQYNKEGCNEIERKFGKLEEVLKGVN